MTNSARESVLTHRAGRGGAVHLVAAGPPFCHRRVDPLKHRIKKNRTVEPTRCTLLLLS
ncbi:hypothetical protein F4824DRAFT_476230 [Ustulina deusta]|nr:hypothetical protein F4824DRAFT_476230 [Ustulina deusta]